MHYLYFFLLIINVTICSAAPSCYDHKKNLQLPFRVDAQNLTDLEIIQEQYNQQDAILQIQKRSLREQMRQLKREEREQNRHLQAKRRCEKIKRQIEILNKRYKQGYTASKGNTLDRKLSELKTQKQHHCS